MAKHTLSGSRKNDARPVPATAEEGHRGTHLLVSTAKYVNVFLLAAALLATGILVVILLADRWVENSFFAAHVLNFLLQNHLLGGLFIPTGLLATLHIAGFFGGYHCLHLAGCIKASV